MPLTFPSDRQLLSALETYPAGRWFSLCNGAGWTPIALTAYSWCQNAPLEDLLDGWERLGDQGRISVNPAAQRAATFINPQVLPENRLSAILTATENPSLLKVIFAARNKLPEHDLSKERFATLDSNTQRLIGDSASIKASQKS